MTLKCQSTTVVLVRPLAVAERIYWNRVCPSFCPVVCRCFLGIGSLDFLDLWHGARGPYENVCDRTRVPGKIFLAPKIGEIDQKWFCFEFKENVGHWFLLNSFYNENLYYLQCSCTNAILRKILFLRYRPNAVNQSDCLIFKSTISPEQIDEIASFFACRYKFTKIKLWKFFSWACPKIGLTSLVSGL